MENDFVLHLGRRALETALLLSAPVLIVTLLIGFATAMLQAVTSIRDMTMGMVMKLAGVGVTILVCGNWMIQLSVSFTTDVLNYVQTMGR